MVDSGVESRPASSMKQINNLMVKESYSLNLYPASVGELTAMIGHARKESFPECASFQSTPEGARAFFKKSHTCGSLYAKCGCNNDSPFIQTYSTPSPEPPPSPSKRGSTPVIATIYPRSDTKRLSNPEINKTVIKANVYLNHPEITFPIPVELPKAPNSLPTSIDLDEIKKSNLDYHKYNALVYESTGTKDQEAKKFLSDFGIFGPMGNGVATTLRRSSKSSVDGDVIQQIRKNSRNLVDSKRRHSGAQEENDYMKTLVARLKKELSVLEVKYGTLQTELYDTRKELTCKDSEVVKLQREIHKLKVSLISVVLLLYYCMLPSILPPIQRKCSAFSTMISNVLFKCHT